jgi:hypothetical protein
MLGNDFFLHGTPLLEVAAPVRKDVKSLGSSILPNADSKNKREPGTGKRLLIFHGSGTKAPVKWPI